ncbi:hypothetical protein [Nocardia sp. MW-W600-9]
MQDPGDDGTRTSCRLQLVATPAAQPAAHRGRDALALDFGPVGVGSAVSAVHRGVPEPDPAVEMLGGEGPGRVQRGMRGEHVALILGVAEERAGPEIRDPGQMCVQLHGRDLGEIGPDERVGEGNGVEVAQQRLQIRGVGDIPLGHHSDSQ